MERLFGTQNKYRKSVEVDKNTLGNLLITARINDPKLRTVIKGDKNAPYGPDGRCDGCFSESEDYAF
jgi:hypothetical protein